MARILYSETYTEIDLNSGKKRSLERKLDLEGTSSELKELFPVSVASMPRYNWRILDTRENFLQLAFIHLNNKLLE